MNRQLLLALGGLPTELGIRVRPNSASTTITVTEGNFSTGNDGISAQLVWSCMEQL